LKESVKIKTITCHEVYNHGASLQEYALLKYLKILGHEAEAINYKPDYLSQHFKLWLIDNPKWGTNIIFKIAYLGLKLPGRLKALKRKKSFDAFSQKFITTYAGLYESNEELKANLPPADAFICGSDQIWNSFFQNGKDPAFYLDFVPDDKLKISYAASFAIDEIDEDLKPFVKEKVHRINHISVRETSGKRILSELGIDKVTQVLDPVFLLPASHWRETFVEEIPNDFIFIYDFDSNPIIKKLAKKMAKEKHLKIFTVNQNIDYADRNYFLEGPDKFLSLMYYAQFIITNSFHSVAFSLIFEKQFVVVNRIEKINTRMRDLLALLELSHLLITDENQFNKFDLIDYQKLDKIKETAIIKSKEFLNKALI
jgi:hypothetical protein